MGRNVPDNPIAAQSFIEGHSLQLIHDPCARLRRPEAFRRRVVTLVEPRLERFGRSTAQSVIFPLLQSGTVKPIVAKTFPTEAADALRYLVEGRPFGRVFLTI